MPLLDPTGILSRDLTALRGLAWKEPCLVATTANVTLSGTQTIDGVAVTAGKRVLVKDQSAGAENGIWVCAAGAWTRAYDMDQDAQGTTDVAAEELLGAVVLVVSGTANGGTLWRCTNTSPPTLGTTALTFASILSGVAVALDDLTDVDLTSPQEDDTLRFDGTHWVNDNRRWEPVTTNPGGGPELVWDGDDIVMTWRAY